MTAELGVIAFSIVVAIGAIRLWSHVQRSGARPSLAALAYVGLSVGSAFVVGSLGGGLEVDPWAIIVSEAVVLGGLMVAFLVVAVRTNAAVQAQHRDHPADST